MEVVRKVAFFGLLVLCSLTLLGCGKKADENKPIPEAKAEAEKMNVEQLRSMAMKYKEAVTAKTDEVKKFTDKLKEIPITKMMGEEAKELKADITDLNDSIKALNERFQVYYEKLKEKGGDLSGLSL